MKEKLSSFKKFNSVREESKSLKEEQKTKLKINSLHEEKINAQRKLEELERNYIQTEKENKSEREKLKKEIIEQNRVLKEKVTEFSKLLGEQEIIDLEI
jgi:hypothetical protein